MMMERKLKRMRNIENVDNYEWKLKPMRGRNSHQHSIQASCEILLICKSVCKRWRDLICSPSFILLHLMQSQQKPAVTIYAGDLVMFARIFIAELMVKSQARIFSTI